MLSDSRVTVQAVCSKVNCPPGWRDVSGRVARGESGGAAAALEALAGAAAGARARPPAAPPRASRKKTATIRQLFTAASKFQKNLRRYTCQTAHNILKSYNLL